MDFFKKIKSYLQLQGNIVKSVNGYNNVLKGQVVNDIRFHQKYEELTAVALSELKSGLSDRK